MRPGKLKNILVLPKKTKTEHLSLFVTKAKRLWDIVQSQELIKWGHLDNIGSTNIKSKVLRLDNGIAIDPNMSELYKFIAISFCCRLVWIKKLQDDGTGIRTFEIWGPEHLIPYVDITIGYYHNLSYKMRNQMRTQLKNRNEYLRRKSRETGKKIHTIDPRVQANDFYKVIVTICDADAKDIFKSLGIGIMSNAKCRLALQLVDNTLIQEGNLNFKGFVKRFEIKRIVHASSTPKKYTKRRVLSKGLNEFNIFE